VSLMAAAGEAAAGLRDTVFAAMMIILNGIIVCVCSSAASDTANRLSASTGVSAALAALATIVIMTAVCPNYTVTTPGRTIRPVNSSRRRRDARDLRTFIFTQTVGHRQYFLQEDEPSNRRTHSAAEQRGNA